MHLAITVDVNIARTIGIEKLLEQSIFVVILTDFWQAHVNFVQIHWEIHEQLLLPRISVVLRNHHKRITEVIEGCESNRIAACMNGVCIAAEAKELGAIEFWKTWSTISQ